MLAFVLPLHAAGAPARAPPIRCDLRLARWPWSLVAWTNPWHRDLLVVDPVEDRSLTASRWRSADTGRDSGRRFGYCYILVAVSVVLLAEAVVRSAGVYRAQAAVMLFGVLVPWVVSIIDMSHVFGHFYVDLAAASFAVTGLAFVPGLSRFRLLDLTPVAWATVVERINDAGRRHRRAGPDRRVNAAAQRLVGRPPRDVLAVEAARVFAAWPALADRLERLDRGRGRELRARGARTGAGLVLRRADLAAGRRRTSGRLGSWSSARSPSGSGRGGAGPDAARAGGAGRGRGGDAPRAGGRAEAEAASRAKDRFLATLSHELRTPLTPILATATAMLDDPDTPAAFRSVLEMIRRNVALEARLIDDLLDLTRIRGGKLHLERAVIDAHELIHQVVEICREDLRSKGLRLVLDLAARRHHVDADPTRLQQVLWNLIKNAIKFTPPGGTITVRSRDDERIGPGRRRAPA